MSTLTIEINDIKADNVKFADDTFFVDLSDGRTIAVPIAWYPRLFHANQAERNNWRLIGNGEGIHWQDLDEDISIENLISGKSSQESQSSFKKWLANRNQ
jgi:hypothetical protein